MASQSHPEQQAFLLRSIAERMDQPPLKTLIKAPQVLAAYRVTVYYHDRRALDSCATLWDRRLEGVQLVLCYRGMFDQKPITRPLSETRYDTFTQALQKLRFDHLADQPDMPLYGLDFWMVERAAGSFIHSVIVAPQTATGSHADLVQIIQTHLPESLREVSI